MHLIELTGGAEAQWAEKNDMPYPRILGDALVLCDGSVGVFGGGQRGVAGWGMHAYDYEFRDGTSWSCKNLCTDVYDFLYEPTIWDPATGALLTRVSLGKGGQGMLRTREVRGRCPACARAPPRITRTLQASGRPRARWRSTRGRGSTTRSQYCCHRARS